LKNDARDCGAMAELLIRGSGRPPQCRDEALAAQAAWVAHRRRKVAAQVVLANQIHGQLDLVFPGLTGCFAHGLDAASLRVLIRDLPDPDRVRRLGVNARGGMFAQLCEEVNRKYLSAAAAGDHDGGLQGLLACSARKVFGVEDQHGVAFQLDPATVGESAERLVRRLPARANQLSDLLLGQVVGDSQRVAFTGAELLCQLQQLLGDPSGDVGEDLISQFVVGAPQPAGQYP
jgi:hypothetical protein